MASKISIPGGLIDASIDDLKAVYVWVVLITFFCCVKILTEIILLKFY